MAPAGRSQDGRGASRGHPRVWAFGGHPRVVRGIPAGRPQDSRGPGGAPAGHHRGLRRISTGRSEDTHRAPAGRSEDMRIRDFHVGQYVA